MENRKNYFIEKFSCLLFFAFIISNFLPSNLRNIVAILLLVISIVYVFKEKIKFTTDSDALKLLKSYVYFFLIILLFATYHNSSIQELDTYSRFILILPLFYLFSRVRINQKHFYITIIITSLIAGVTSLYQYIDRDVGIERISGFTSVSISFGNMSMTIFLLALISLMQKNTNRIKILLIISMILSLLAWSLSLSKGSLIGLFISVVYLIFSKELILSKKSFITVLILFVSFVYLSPAKQSLDRLYYDIANSSGHLSEIYKDKDISFSTKERVFLLLNAKEIIDDNFFTGIGFSNFKEHIVKKTELVNRQYGMAQHDHVHNDFIDVWVKAGAFTVLALIYFFFIHLRVLTKYRREKGDFFSLVAIVLLLSQIGFMMTQSQFAHHQPTLFFLLLLIVATSQVFLKSRT